MVIGLKCYLGIALPFGILTFFLDLLVPEISRIFIKISSKTEAHNADKIYAYKKRRIVSMVFYFCDTLVNQKDLLFLKKFYSFFKVEKNVNFRGIYFRELSIFEIFRGRNFRELLLKF